MELTSSGPESLVSLSWCFVFGMVQDIFVEIEKDAFGQLFLTDKCQHYDSSGKCPRAFNGQVEFYWKVGSFSG